MGEMLKLLKASDVCFMGGSLIGHKVGGHNVLEYTNHYWAKFFSISKEITESLIEQNGIWVRRD